MADKVSIEMFRSIPGRWNFCIIWNDGVHARSTRAMWGFNRAYRAAVVSAQHARQEARHGV